MRKLTLGIFQAPPLPETVPAARIPGWDTTTLSHRLCPVCQTDNPQAVVRRPDDLLVHKCSQCGALYLADLPSEEETIAFYRSYSDFKQNRPSNAKPLALPFYYYADPFISVLQATGGIREQSICEIGCSYGSFLELIRYGGGYPFGVELDEAASVHLSQRGIPNSRTLNSQREYDVICLFQVLEHLRRPLDMVSSLSAALKPDGRLLISVPNGGEYGKIGSSWVGFRVDLEHINYFDLNILAKLLEPFGLFIEQFWEHAQPQIRRLAGSATSTSSPLSLVVQKSAATIKRLLWGRGIAEQGSFVLTVLARKARTRKAI